MVRCLTTKKFLVLFFFFAVIEGEGNLIFSRYLCVPDNATNSIKYFISPGLLHNSVRFVMLALFCRRGSMGWGRSGTVHG